jgi:hypothetical protein
MLMSLEVLQLSKALPNPEKRETHMPASNKALSVIIALFAATAATAAIADHDANPSGRVGVYDHPTPTIQFIKPRPNEVIGSTTVLFQVAMQNYDFRPEMAFQPPTDRYGAPSGPNGEVGQVPNQGHYHLYLVRPDSTVVQHFTAPGSEAVTATIETGPWCAYADLTHHNHLHRQKAHPRELPTFDKVCFFVVPGRGDLRDRISEGAAGGIPG